MVELYKHKKFVLVNNGANNECIANRTSMFTSPTLLENAAPQIRPSAFNGLWLGKDNEGTLFYNVLETYPLTLEKNLTAILKKCEKFNITVVKNKKGYKFCIYDADDYDAPTTVLKTYRLEDLTKEWYFVEYYLPVEKYCLNSILRNEDHELAIKYLIERQVNVLLNGF